jgi:vitamin B12/bleomycin/antimicrobial peptide transport system ATP-binding/permease protein
MPITSPLLKRLRSFRDFIRRVWALSAPYFQSEERWQARGLLLSIVMLNLGSVWMLVQINDWNGLFYDALQNKDEEVFWTQLLRFTYLAFGYILIAVYKFYLRQLLEMRWRAWMTSHYLDRWLANRTFYQFELTRYASVGGSKDTTPDNPDQRIQEDIAQFTTKTMTLSMGLLNAFVTLVSFAGILWMLSGGFVFSFNDESYEIPGFMLWMALLYCIVGSVLTHLIGRPQIKLNFDQERYEADFRHHLVRVREYSESIALDRGEKFEREHLGTRLSGALSNYLKLIRAQKNLSWFTYGFSQAELVFPFIVAAPRFFSGAIQLGQLIQITTAFSRVQDSLSWFVDNYEQLASWRAITDRLTSFNEKIQTINQSNVSLVTKHSDQLASNDLTISLPDGNVMLSQTVLHAGPGDTVLIQGPSGSGKSSLFRTFAEIWPFATGSLERPLDAVFIPQRPYIPNGSLRNALLYPNTAACHTDEDLQNALSHAMLAHLRGRLNEENAWSQQLSGGEQQRLALARVFLMKPNWIFADEATSALDESTEALMYERLSGLIKSGNGALISIAHRTSVLNFHHRTWLFEQRNGSLASYTLNTSS